MVAPNPMTADDLKARIQQDTKPLAISGYRARNIVGYLAWVKMYEPCVLTENSDDKLAVFDLVLHFAYSLEHPTLDHPSQFVRCIVVDLVIRSGESPSVWHLVIGTRGKPELICFGDLWNGSCETCVVIVGYCI